MCGEGKDGVGMNGVEMLLKIHLGDMFSEGCVVWACVVRSCMVLRCLVQ